MSIADDIAAAAAAAAATVTKSAVHIARDARLDRLQKATLDWAGKEEQRLKDEVSFLQSVLQGRTGAGRLASQNVADTYKITVDAIKTFLEG